MKLPRKFFSDHMIVFWAVGLGLSFFCGWSLSRQTEAGSGGDSGSRSHHAQSMPDASDRQGTGSEADSRVGRRSKGGTVSRKDSKDFAQSVRAVFRENVKQRRIDKFQILLERTGIEHLPELVSLLRENDLRGNDSGEEWSRIWTNWGERDPQAAMDFFKTYDWTGWNSPAIGEARNRTVASWAQTDPEGARKFVEADPDFVQGDRTLVFGFVEGWANVDPEGAAGWLLKTGMASGSEYFRIVAALSRKGGQQGVDEWFLDLDSKGISAKDKEGFASAIAHTKQQYEPDKAAEWIDGHLGEAWVEGSEIVGTTARAFAQRDARAAVEWASKTGLEEARHIAVSAWCDQDIRAASSWAKENAHLPGNLQTAALVMEYMERKDPEAAREWAEGITDQSVRERLLRP